MLAVTDETPIRVTVEPTITRGSKAGGGRLGFYLFLGVNFLLLVRPQELFPQIRYLRPYEMLMLGCLAVFGLRMLDELQPSRLLQRPITACVLGLLPVTLASILWNGRGDMFFEYGMEFSKMLLYYLVLVCAVDTPKRLRQFCVALALILAFVALLPVLDSHGVVTIESIQAIKDTRDQDGQASQVMRLIGVGIFADPNDLAQILGLGLILSFYGMDLTRGRVRKALWLAPMALMLYAMYLTHSRGGFLGLVAGIVVLFINRYGWKKAVILGACAVPVLVGVFLARTSISTNEASAQSRVQLWSDALLALRYLPVLGLGPGVFNEEAGQVAHNSFLQAFAELGLPGGLLFFTACFVAIWGVLRLRNRKIQVLQPDLAKLTPTLSAALVCYCVGMLSLTRNYVIPTYTVLGLAAVYLAMVRTNPARKAPSLTLGLLGRAFALSVVYLLAMQIFVRMSVRWSV